MCSAVSALAAQRATTAQPAWTVWRSCDAFTSGRGTTQPAWAVWRSSGAFAAQGADRLGGLAVILLRLWGALGADAQDAADDVSNSVGVAEDVLDFLFHFFEGAVPLLLLRGAWAGEGPWEEGCRFEPLSPRGKPPGRSLRRAVCAAVAALASALPGACAAHPELADLPFFVTGESYAGASPASCGYVAPGGASEQRKHLRAHRQRARAGVPLPPLSAQGVKASAPHCLGRVAHVDDVC